MCGWTDVPEPKANGHRATDDQVNRAALSADRVREEWRPTLLAPSSSPAAAHASVSAAGSALSRSFRKCTRQEAR